MKRVLSITTAMLSVCAAFGQQKEGKVLYERTTQMQQISFGGMNAEMQRMIPKSRTDKFELSFANNQSLWRAGEEEATDDNMSFGGEGGQTQIRMTIAGGNDVVFSNLGTSQKIERRELFDKSFIILDSLRPGKWKMTGETKSILNHNCMKATTTQINQRTRMSMENGKMERKDVSDTANIVAWFASDIPVSVGPGEFQGQLPGLILEMDVNNGRQVYKATEISAKVDAAIIKAPTGKKTYTPQEFAVEREKMMKEMQSNSGGNRRFIMN